jgi:hypothetical protein
MRKSYNKDQSGIRAAVLPTLVLSLVGGWGRERDGVEGVSRNRMNLREKMLV